jgi:hypothetical protein
MGGVHRLKKKKKVTHNKPHAQIILFNRAKQEEKEKGRRRTKRHVNIDHQIYSPRFKNKAFSLCGFLTP